MWVYSLRFDIDKVEAYMADFSLLGTRHVEAELLNIR